MTNVGIGAGRSHEYELGHSDQELRRLGAQARLVDPMTKQFFTNAGVAAGMRVLDIGSGAGDVAFLAAELVGTSGEVVGTDRSLTAVEAARTAAKSRGLTNVSFVEGDPSALTFDRPFDSIVGRYVLMFSPQPIAMLKGIAPHLRPGGILVFHEADWRGVFSSPPAPTYDRCCDWIVRTFHKVGTNPHMGLGLYSAFVAAGFPAPAMSLQALVGGAAGEANGLDLITDLAVAMAPVMQQMGVATAAELEAATLYARTRAEIESNASVVVGRSEVGAWSVAP